jgi:hypothetical protein
VGLNGEAVVVECDGSSLRGLAGQGRRSLGWRGRRGLLDRRRRFCRLGRGDR